MTLLECVERVAAGAQIFFATDHSPLAQMAARRFGGQMLPTTPGAPFHTFRPMDKVVTRESLSLGADGQQADPHIKQMLDFVLLASTPRLMLTCGTYGGGVRMLSHVVQESLQYIHQCPVVDSANTSTRDVADGG